MWSIRVDTRSNVRMAVTLADDPVRSPAIGKSASRDINMLFRLPLRMLSLQILVKGEARGLCRRSVEENMPC